MLKKIIFFFFIFTTTLNAFAGINAPDLRCIAVAPNGDVTINWLIPADPLNKFNYYAIFKSNTKTGPYTQITSITTYSASSYTDVGAGANTSSYFYYAKTDFGPGSNLSASSDTLQSILLNLAGGGAIANLTWNAIHTPPLSSSTGIYDIYREYPVGTWTKIGSNTSLNYMDTISLICNSTFLNYRVEIADQSGCISISSIQGNNFFDQTPPKKTFLKSVSVDPSTGIVSINWFQNGSKDTKKYIIYKVINGVNFPIDTVYGVTTTSYTNTASTANSASEYYDIATLDSCGGTGNLSDTIHKTIFTNVLINRCDGSASLVWNRYYHMPSGVGKYNIYVSINGGTFAVTGTNSSNDTTFTHTGLTSGSNYCYYIEAINVNGDITSTSNKICVTANVSKIPAFLYLRKASVSGNKTVTITGHTDVAAGIAYYVIKRANNNIGPFDSIGQIPYSVTPTIIFTDTTAQTSVRSYYYRLVAVDSCGNEKLTSNDGRTIFLEVTADIEGHSNILTWNEYEKWLGSVSSYNIYRSVDGVFNLPPVDNVLSSGTSYTYTDDISGVLNGEGVFYYEIEALEGNGNTYGFLDTSLSNIAQATHNAFMYIPSAFTPGDKNGLNTLFIPVNTYVSKTDYSFEIFDRWGVLVFSTNDPAIGWNGTYQSGKTELGVYVYSLSFKDSFNNPFEKKGAVTLLR